ncbi:MAG: AMP-binding protein [Thermoplasmataceae archaeon]
MLEIPDSERETVDESSDIPLSSPRVIKRDVYDILSENIPSRASFPAIIYYGRRITYFQVISAVDSLAAELSSKFKIQKGDRIAVSLPNSPQFIVSFFAILKIGAVVVPLNTGQNAADFVRKLEILEVKGIITDSKGYVLLRNSLNSRMFVMVTRVQDFMPFGKATRITYFDTTWGQVKWGGNVYPFSDFIFNGSGERCIIDPGRDVAIIQLTGVQLPGLQAVSLTHANILGALKQVSEVFSITGKKSVVACISPFSIPYGYIFGFLLSMLTGRACTMFFDNRDSRTVSKMCRKIGVDILVAHPWVYSKLLSDQACRKDLKRILIYVNGTDNMTEDLSSTIVDTMKGKLLQVYGFSETTGVTHYRWIDDTKRSASIIGIPFKETKCRIVDQTTSEDIKLGDKGELLVKGPQVPTKYLFTIVGERDRFSGEWFHTGDNVVSDVEGSYTIVEKMRDMIVSNAIPVFPVEIEAVINSYPEVKESAVIGINDGNRGEAIKAFIVSKDGTDSCLKGLKKYLSGNLAEYQRPLFYEFRSELPKSMTGKIIKRILIEQAKGKT